MRKLLVFVLLIHALSTPLLAQSLSQALNNNDTSAALQIIKAGYNFDSTDESGSSILLSFCRATDDTVNINFLLNHGAKADYPKSPTGRTALIVACAYYGGVPLCRVLLNHGADVNAVTKKGETALMLAAKNAKYDVVVFLLKQGANAKLTDASGKTALDYAKAADIDETMKKMLSCCEVDKEKTIQLLAQTLNK